MNTTRKPQRPRIRGVQPEVREAALRLRKELPPAERILWEHLRDRALCGLKFRRQHPVGQIILDFFCPSCKLAIEIDGAVHDLSIFQDEARTQHLEKYGYRVLRFRNEEVLDQLASVLERIREAVS